MKLFAERLETFLPPDRALEEGLVDVSDNISVERLLEAYSFGIFPWPQEGFPILWFSPKERGVLEFKDLHVPKSLAKWRKRNSELTLTWNQAFVDVISACARVPRPGQSGTWITSKLKAAYVDFHHAGYAHSLECWRENELVGGIYGVYVAGVFCGESMFHREANVSKLCMVQLVKALKSMGLKWMDIQMLTPVTEALGGKLIARKEFLSWLAKSKMAAQPLQLESPDLKI
jgi:leucyl/phenylalanyl-tRNA--protein transferase